jgi:transposase-like protein
LVLSPQRQFKEDEADRSKKTMLTGSSTLMLDTPRDRFGTFDPKLIAKYQRRFLNFDDKIISMYARGMTVREIRGHLEELYGIDVSPDLIWTATDSLLALVIPPLFSGALALNLRGQLQFLGGRYAADAQVRSFMVVSP